MGSANDIFKCWIIWVQTLKIWIICVLSLKKKKKQRHTIDLGWPHEPCNPGKRHIQIKRTLLTVKIQVPFARPLPCVRLDALYIVGVSELFTPGSFKFARKYNRWDPPFLESRRTRTLIFSRNYIYNLPPSAPSNTDQSAAQSLSLSDLRPLQSPFVLRSSCYSLSVFLSLWFASFAILADIWLLLQELNLLNSYCCCIIFLFCSFFGCIACF